MHKTIALTAVAFVALAAPAAAHPVKPTHGERANAAKQCRAERGTTPEEHAAFRDEYGTGERKRNAFGRCVSHHARDRAHKRRRAIRACRQELREIGPEAFREKYGNGNGHPFRSCVRTKLAGPGDDEQPPAEREPAEAPESGGEQADERPAPKRDGERPVRSERRSNDS